MPNPKLPNNSTQSHSKIDTSADNNAADEFDFDDEDQPSSSSASSPSGYADQQEYPGGFNNSFPYRDKSKTKHHPFGQGEYEVDDCLASI